MKPSVCSPLTVETASIPMRIEYQGILLCSVLISYPVFKGEAPKRALKWINAYYKRFSKKLAKYAETTLRKNATADYEYRKANDFPFNPYELRSDFTVTYNKDSLLSLYTDVYEFTGGAHGNTQRLADIWYTHSGFPAPVSDFFDKGTNYKKLLTNSAIRQAEAQIKAGTDMYFDNYPELIKKYYSKKKIYLTESGMALFYQQYEIAPYAEGIPVFITPYNSEAGPKLPACPPKSLLDFKI